VTAPKPTNQRRLMTGVHISPIQTPDERCVTCLFSHGLVAFGPIAFAHTARRLRATGPQKTSELSSCQHRVSLLGWLFTINQLAAVSGNISKPRSRRRP
jgi:hypothetical protein